MSIDAIALLRTRELAPHGLRTQLLEDAVLVHTQRPFDTAPQELAALLREALGDAFEGHDDPRGLFILPSVAAPTAQRYEQVLEEVGAGGFWIAPSELGAPSEPDLAALLGGMLGQSAGDLLQSIARAAEAGDAGMLQQMAQNLDALLDPSTPPNAEALAQAAQFLTGGRGPDPAALEQLLTRLGSGTVPELEKLLASDAPAPTDLQDLVSNLQSQLAADPALLSGLMEHFFGEAAKSPKA
jgi:hypothetical protein